MRSVPFIQITPHSLLGAPKLGVKLRQFISRQWQHSATQPVGFDQPVAVDPSPGARAAIIHSTRDLMDELTPGDDTIDRHVERHVAEHVEGLPLSIMNQPHAVERLLVLALPVQFQHSLDMGGGVNVHLDRDGTAIPHADATGGLPVFAGQHQRFRVIGP